MDFMIMGKKIPLAYTIGAKKELLAHFGDNEKLTTALLCDSDVELAERASAIGSIMAKAEWKRQKAQAVLFGTEVTAIHIEEADLFNMLDDASTLELVKAITETVREANKTTVQAVDESKKDEAGQSK